METNPVENEHLTVKRINQRTVILGWNIPTSLSAQAITEFQYSIDGGQTWISTRSTNTSITITSDEVGDLSQDQFQIRAVSRNADNTARVVTTVISAPKRLIIHQCPVGWVRSDRFGGRNRRVLLYEVNLEMDLHNRVSIYKPVSVAIYVPSR